MYILITTEQKLLLIKMFQSCRIMWTYRYEAAIFMISVFVYTITFWMSIARILICHNKNRKTNALLVV